MKQASLPAAASDSQDALLLAPGDDVLVALKPLGAGQRIVAAGNDVVLRHDVPFGHKLALRAVASGQAVQKFGWPIGRATESISPGDHVHTHNLITALSGVEGYAYQPVQRAEPRAAAAPGFRGYRRADGRVGTRNEIWILPTVGCVARTAGKIAALAQIRLRGSIDGVHALTHPFGCSQLGEDLAGTRTLLAALACHPNAGGVLLVGLGCESNQLDELLEEVPQELRYRIRTLRAQSAGDEIAEGVALVDKLIAAAAEARREEVGFGEMVIGLKCGGSDGLSGLTANPLVGRAADRVVASGGSAILSEIPEVFGAERLLMARARDEGVFRSIVDVVNAFKSYFLTHRQPVSENTSPGNIAGGITTLEEKSLGAVQKAGRSPVEDVLRYGQRVRRPGLSLLEAPGNDAVSSTALVAAGATIVLFTTGRGTPLGFPAPTMKIASNTELAERKRNWIDFDAGAVLQEGIEPVTDRLVAKIAEIASGQTTCAERNGEREIAIWKRGVTL